MLNLGLDIGNNSVKAVVLNKENKIVYKKSLAHHGQSLKHTFELIKEIKQEFGNLQVSFTGVHATLFVDASKVIENVPAVEKGISFLSKEAKSIIEIGAQSACYITGINSNKAPQFAVNENCAGGTGSFFEDQMYRLGLKIEDYSTLIKEAQNIPRISGRCSVFAKSDIIHRQQEGAETADILLGLCYATIRNLKATVIRNLPIEKPMALCGGVIKNEGVIQAVKEVFDLKDNELIISEDNTFAQAIGAAYLGREKNLSINSDQLVKSKSNRKDNLSYLSPLKQPIEGIFTDVKCIKIEGRTPCTLGIDIGSTSTNLVLINEEGQVVDLQYLRTKGDPQRVVKEGLLAIRDKFGDLVDITGVGVTGSGRYLIGKMIGADITKDEITAQAQAAFKVNPEVDTVFEIGGQDSKYIQMENGVITDFQMNKICAAGTGSFIEEQAGRMGIELSNYGNLALSAKNPINLGERCTVFIESNIASALSKGAETEDILAGLAYSIINNYSIKVVGNKPVGNHIVLQGGVCYNSAVVAAFRSVFGDKVMVNPYFSVSGAYGIALLAAKEMQGKLTTFKGYDLSKDTTNQLDENKNEMAQNIKRYNKEKELLIGDYSREVNHNQTIIGVPYALVMHKFFPLVRNFFENLGFQVLLSPESNEELITLSQEHAQAETCYPVKLIYGHMAWLAKQKVDYIFFPSIMTMNYESSKIKRNYGCVYMQTAPKMIFNNLQLGKQGIKLLCPQFDMNFGQEALGKSMIQMGVKLGKKPEECKQALVKGSMAVKQFTTKVEKIGADLLKDLKEDDKVIVLVTRNYGLSDPVLNMGIPEELLKRGYKVITNGHLPSHDLDISEEYSNLYWPFGQHIISGAKLIANHPNLFAVYLNNHGCGPDSMISHLFKKEMQGKPYLNIEVDEHFSKVGVVTRIEAFLQSLNSYKQPQLSKTHDYFHDLPSYEVNMTANIQKDKKLYLPNLFPYTQILSGTLTKLGYETEVMELTTQESLMRGRKFTSSKEYLAFTALLGDVLTLESKINNEAQVLLPQTEGSETDGVYPRVIHNYLQENSHLTITTKMLETLPFVNKNMEQIFLSLMAGDLVLMEAIDKREALVNKFKTVDITLELLLEIAKEISFNNNRKIAVVGDPYIVYNSFLNQELLTNLEKDNYSIQWMPLTEYLCFMWYKQVQTDDEKCLVNFYCDQLAALAKVLGKHSPYSTDIPNLLAIANDKFKNFTGGNGAYRYAKTKELKNCNAIFDIASTHENTQTILGLVNDSDDLPTLFLNFEGTNDNGVKEQVKSFLYYI